MEVIKKKRVKKYVNQVYQAIKLRRKVENTKQNTKEVKLPH